MKSKNLLVIANLKMKMVRRRDMTTYCDHLRRALATASDLRQGVTVVVAGSAPHLDIVARSAATEPRISVGSQNIFYERQGSYTGQISPITLKDSGVQHVVIGHSEQHQFGHMTDEEVGRNAAAALIAEMTPVILVGETAQERERGAMKDALSQHLRSICAHIRAEDIERCVFVYEPLWAIGASAPPSVEDIMSARILLQRILADLYDVDRAQSVQILYGGSVTPENVGMFTPEVGITGVILGRAGMDYQKTLQIASSLKHQFRDVM